jgi:hypothetical protein
MQLLSGQELVAVGFLSDIRHRFTDISVESGTVTKYR